MPASPRCLSLITLLAGGALALAGPQAQPQDMGDGPPPAVLFAEGEPGQRLTVAGRVVQPDGQPAAGTSLYIYNTDARGEYGTGGDGSSHRISATLVTDAQGRYSILTILPASYPGTTVSPHIHYRIRGEDGLEQRRTLHLVNPEAPATVSVSAGADRDSFSPRQVPVRDAAGRLQARFDIRLRK